MDFSEAAQAQMRGDIVRAALLVEFRFVSGTVRLWEGSGRLRTRDGNLWDGTAGMGEVSGLGQSVNGSAPSLVLSLSGVDAEFAAKAKGESADYYNRAVVVYLQFFADDWSCLDNPYPITLARMMNLTASKKTDDKGPVYTVAVTAETPFATRRRPKYGFWTDTDQRQRFPGDRGLERVAGIDQKNITFPDF
jgi:hypothetical protein